MRSIRGRIVPAAVGVAVTMMLLPQTGAAAEPRPTVAQAKARLAKLNDQADQMVEKYNDAMEKYKAAKKKYGDLDRRLARELGSVAGLRAELISTAVGTYQAGDTLGWAGFAAQPDPSGMLAALATADQLAEDRARVLQRFDEAAKGLRDRRAAAKSAYDDAARLLNNVRDQKKVEKLVSEQERLLRRLGQYNLGNPHSTGIKYTGPASGNARVALQFAFAQAAAASPRSRAPMISPAVPCCSIAGTSWSGPACSTCSGTGSISGTS